MPFFRSLMFPPQNASLARIGASVALVMTEATCAFSHSRSVGSAVANRDGSGRAKLRVLSDDIISDRLV